MTKTESILREIAAERARQHARFGEQNLPDGTALAFDDVAMRQAKGTCERAAALGTLTFRDILDEEVCEAFAESDPVKLRNELLQVAAVCCQWVEKLDREAAARSAA